MNYFDVMVDIETTGTSPDEAAIIQLAAVKFNLAERTIDSSNMFNRCLTIPPKRFWDEGTREWWARQKREILLGIYGRMEEPRTVLQDFAKWSGYSNDEPLRLWSKPTHFDFSFLQSYFTQFEISNPYHFRYATDMNSFIRGLANDSTIPTYTVPFEGDAHNAIFDVLNQINTVFQAADHYAPRAA